MTSVGWVTSAEPEDVKTSVSLSAYRHRGRDQLEDDAAIWESAAGLTIVQAQDLLGLGSWSRMNTPSTVGKKLEMEGTERQFHVGIV